MLTYNLSHQRGIGLVEVLVALLLLSVAVLGFSAMQMRAVKATDETLMRSDAMAAVRSLSEDLRMYSLQTGNSKEEYAKVMEATQSKPAKDCTTEVCDAEAQMKYNVYEAQQLAKDNGVTLAVANCPGVTVAGFEKLCIIAAWDDTQAEFSDTAPTKDARPCATTKGEYNAGAKCFIMEAY